jgi:hypothetical protein
MCTVCGLGISVYSALRASRVENTAGAATTLAMRSATEILVFPSTVLVPVERHRCLQQDSAPDTAAGTLILLGAVLVPLSAGFRKKSRRFAVACRYRISPSYRSDAQD